MIGLLDSGVGGLSVLMAIEAFLPHKACIYYADTAHFPYGEKSRVEIEHRCLHATAFLLSKGVDLVIVACHTATIAALKTLQKNFPIPIIGMVEPTLRALPSGAIALLGSKATIDSGVYQKAIPQLTAIACPELIKGIEKESQDLQPLIRKSLSPLLTEPIGTLILGCSHLHFASHQIEEELNQKAQLLNPAVAVASEANRLVPISKQEPPRHALYVTGNIEAFKAFVTRYSPNAPYEVASA